MPTGERRSRAVPGMPKRAKKAAKKVPAKKRAARTPARRRGGRGY